MEVNGGEIMVVAGVLIKIKSEEEKSIITELKKMNGVEAHGIKRGNVAVVIESDMGRKIKKITEEMKNIKGVVGVFPTYIHTEDEILQKRLEKYD